MRTFKISLFLLISNLVVLRANAQQKPLNVGDTLPDIKIENIVNFSDSVLQMSEIDSKLIIIDFWSTWCGTCIRAMPKLDSLQKKFGSEIFILLVTFQDRDKVGDFLATSKYVRGMWSPETSLPTVVEDGLLKTYFPHRGLPHVVWIDRHRVVRATTSTKEVTERNISIALAKDNYAF